MHERFCISNKRESEIRIIATDLSKTPNLVTATTKKRAPSSWLSLLNTPSLLYFLFMFTQFGPHVLGRCLVLLKCHSVEIKSYYFYRLWDSFLYGAELKYLFKEVSEWPRNSPSPSRAVAFAAPRWTATLARRCSCRTRGLALGHLFFSRHCQVALDLERIQ